MSFGYGSLFGSIAQTINQDKGFIYGLANNAITYNQSKKQQERAFQYAALLQAQQAQLNYNYGRSTTINQPGWLRSGLESAGYNPMLAVQNATSGVNSSFAGSGSPVSANPAANPDFASNALSMQRSMNETKTADSTVKLNEAQARNATSEAISKEIHNQFLPDREQKELNQLGAETDKLIRETSYYDQLAENMEAQRRLQEMGIYVDLEGLKYTADKAYNASTYNTNISNITSQINNIRDNRTRRHHVNVNRVGSWTLGAKNPKNDDYFDMVSY